MPGSAAVYRWLPPEGAKILLVLFLSFLIGLEREERKAGAEQYLFGGIRTFPFIGLIGYAIALLSGTQLLPVTVGFAVVAGFLMLSYRHKLAQSALAGVTTEMCGLITYLLGALVYHEQYWIATALGVASALLLEAKITLDSLTKRITPEEILTFTKFLLLTAVILPVLPNQEFGPFRINPFKTWLVVVAVSGVSYSSYVIDKLTKGRGGIVLSAILGGAYSSTATTIVLGKRAAHENQPHLFSGAMLIASGMMYLRLEVLLALFNRSVASTLGPAFTVLAILAVGFGWLWARRLDPGTHAVQREFQPMNPLELRGAMIFALFFLAMIIATNLVVVHLGSAGLYSLAAIMGLVDVDPFVMGMIQSAGGTTPLPVASDAIIIAAASNNFAKAIYAYWFSGRRTGAQALYLLMGLAALGMLPLLWLSR